MDGLLETITILALTIFDIYLFYIGFSGIKNKRIALPTFWGVINYHGDDAIYPASAVIFIAAIFPLSLLSLWLDPSDNRLMPLIMFTGMFCALCLMIYHKFYQNKVHHKTH